MLLEPHGVYSLSTYSMLIANLVSLNARGRQYTKKSREFDELNFLNVDQITRRLLINDSSLRRLQEDLNWDVLEELKSDAYHPRESSNYSYTC